MKEQTLFTSAQFRSDEMSDVKASSDLQHVYGSCSRGLNVVDRFPILMGSETDSVKFFYQYPSFGVGCTQVEIDCLTGDHTVVTFLSSLSRLYTCDMK